MKKTFERKISFVDKNRTKVNIEIEIKTENKNKTFSMSGSYGGSLGQIYDHVKPANKAQKRLITLWTKYHLNDMNAGTIEQEQALKSEEFTKFWDHLKIKIQNEQKAYDELMIDKRIPGKNYNVMQHMQWERKKKEAENLGRPSIPDHYDAAVKFLKSKKLLTVPHPDNNSEEYTYGSAWLIRQLPKDIQNQVEDICLEIEHLEKEAKGISLADMDETELLEFIESNTFFEGRDAELAAAFVRMFSLDENDLQDISIDGNRATVQGTDYSAGNEEEMTEAVTENIKQTLFAFNTNFLASQTDMPEEIFTALQPQYEGANDAIEKLIDKTCGMKEFVEAAVKADGRGHFLNSYNGSELEHTINDTMYFACQN